MEADGVHVDAMNQEAMCKMGMANGTWAAQLYQHPPFPNSATCLLHPAKIWGNHRDFLKISRDVFPCPRVSLGTLYPQECHSCFGSQKIHIVNIYSDSQTVGLGPTNEAITFR